MRVRREGCRRQGGHGGLRDDITAGAEEPERTGPRLGRPRSHCERIPLPRGHRAARLPAVRPPRGPPRRLQASERCGERQPSCAVRLRSHFASAPWSRSRSRSRSERDVRRPALLPRRVAGIVEACGPDKRRRAEKTSPSPSSRPHTRRPLSPGNPLTASDPRSSTYRPAIHTSARSGAGTGGGLGLELLLFCSVSSGCFGGVAQHFTPPTCSGKQSVSAHEREQVIRGDRPRLQFKLHASGSQYRQLRRLKTRLTEGKRSE